MGKIKDIKFRDTRKNGPLAQQMTEDKIAKPTGRVKSRGNRQNEEKFVNDRLTKKILKQAREQQEELEDEFGSTSGERLKQPTTSLTTTDNLSDSDAESELDEDDNDNDNYYEYVEVDEDDERALEMFMNKDPPARRTLADIIMEKITEKQTEIATQFSDEQSLKVSDLDPKVLRMYQSVRQILSRYRSGKLPKAFKIIPNLRNWEHILYVTKPDGWSAGAMYAATRIFASNMKEKMAQRFYNLVLLPRARDDIAEYKKLNFHLYQALRKALFKPGAFFKGILIPLCESGTCTLREAIIFGSVVAKNSIPVLHSSAALLKIAEMDYSGANSVFIRILLDKKYALPYRVVDAVVHHFLRFRHDKRQLPVLWHQAFLTFAQRYKEDISSDQKEALLEILKVHAHHQITAEIRRELHNSKCRDSEMEVGT